jgi:hypothetical protein
MPPAQKQFPDIVGCGLYCFLALDIARGVSSIEIGIGVLAPSIFIDTINKNCNRN